MSDPVNPLEAALGRAGGRPKFLAGQDAAAGPGPDLHRVSANFAAIEAELDAPRPSRLARVLRRFGVADTTIPLVTATPALRRSWVISVLIAVLFALNAATSTDATGADGIIAFLTVAPLVPLAGVALAFGPAVDPTHDIALAAPVDGFRLFLIRAVTVVGASCLLLFLSAWALPTGGWFRVAWLLPALAVTTVCLAVSTRLDPRLSAGGVSIAWLTIVLIANRNGGADAAFGLPAQLVALLVAAAGLLAFAGNRRRLDTLSIDR
ncbi:MAG: zf-HC2 domain-containing protein [Actinomycetota bacterium]